MRLRTLCLLANCLASGALPAQTVVEYVNQADFPRSPNGQYFYTADPGEQAFVDRGAAGQFKRTGGQFPLGGPDPVCRFYGSVTPGPNSHFYTVLPQECASLRALQRTPRPTDTQQWNYEGSPLRASAPTRGADGSMTCAVGTQAIYRAYNNAFTAGGFKNSWDSNHRYSAKLADIQALVNIGWKSDGITLCVPLGSIEAQLPAARTVENQCQFVRPDPKYGDQAGSVETEKAWVRAYMDERYLWTSRSPRVALEEASTATAYFSKKFTPFTSPSGGREDRFSSQTSTTAFESNQTGIVAGYGWSLSVLSAGPPRNFIVRYVESNGAAGLAGVARGMRIVKINGDDFVNGSNTSAYNSALSPGIGSLNSFTLRSPDGSEITVNLIAANTERNAANVVSVLDTPTGKVGYLHYTTFNTLPAEKQMIDAFTAFSAAGVQDLVLDLRYNGGGLVTLSQQMGYMIAGEKSLGKTFMRFTYNEKRDAETHAEQSNRKFQNTTSGFTGASTVPNQLLPTLNLNRVYILTGTGTASASEAVINALRGIDVETILIGNTTTGKPYGSLPTDNCGTTYSALEFKGANAKGFGDYGDGFAPTCTVADDLQHPLGDVREARLAAALTHRSSGRCPSGTASVDSVKQDAPHLIDAPAMPFGEPIDGLFDFAPRKRSPLAATPSATVSR